MLPNSLVANRVPLKAFGAAGTQNTRNAVVISVRHQRTTDDSPYVLSREIYDSTALANLTTAAIQHLFANLLT